MKNRVGSVAAFGGLFAAGALFAAGLSTHFGEVLVENLQIGRAYNTQDLIGLPLRVKNESDKTVRLAMEAVKPAPDPSRKGFEPIPDLSWIRLEKTSHTLAPGAEAVSNVFVTIPKDKSLRGRRFMVQLHSFTVPDEKGRGAAISVGLFSKLLFTISRFEGPDTRQDAAKVFTVMPPDLFLPGIKAGDAVHSGGAFGKALTVHNPNDFECEYLVRSISVTGSEAKLRIGFEELPQPSFIELPETVFRVPPHSDKAVFFIVRIPKNDAFRGKNYMALLRTDQQTGSPRITVYNRLYLFTE